jgi:CubicO group peptidase (beta-lactamase class C family)
VSESSVFHNLPDRLVRAAERAGTPGAVVGVRFGGRTEIAAFGVRKLPDPAPVSIDTIFPIGCVMKSAVARLAASLHLRGLLDLGAPVCLVAPEFAAVDTSRQITLRHLLNHTSGLDEDPLIDTNDGPDRVNEYMRLFIGAFTGRPCLAPPGVFFSYSAAGYVLAAAVIERVVGLPWDAILERHLAGPRGVRFVFGQPNGELDAAIEHFSHPGGSLQAANIYYPPCLDPAGSGRTWSSVPDLLRLVSAEDVAAEELMFQPRTEVGHWTGQEKYGLGHFITRDGLISVMGFGHGSRAELTIAPKDDLAIVVAANASVRGALFPELRQEIVEAAGHLASSDPVGDSRAEVPDPAAPANAYAGVYERFTARLEVVSDVEELALRYFGRLRRGASSQNIALSHHRGNDFNAQRNAVSVRTVSFLSADPSAGFTHARVNGQLFRRRHDTATASRSGGRI